MTYLSDELRREAGAGPCVAGCTIRGKHHGHCPQTCAHQATGGTCPPMCDQTCPGCLPRPATTGRLCAWCSQRLTTDVATAPGLVAHLRELGEPDAAAAPASDTKTYRDPAEGGIVPAAWQAADEIHGILDSWVQLILDTHPSGAAMNGPDVAGAWVTRYGTVAGVRDPRATAELATWLLPWLPWCAEQEWAGLMRREVGSLVATTLARWPTPEAVEPVRAVAMPCPRCGRMSLTYAPPSHATQPFKVSCSDPDCARVWTEDEWEWLVNLVTKGGRP